MLPPEDGLFQGLRKLEYDLEFHAHAEAILKHDFAGIAEELDTVLADFKLNVSELIASGGGVSEPTQRLRKALDVSGWKKHVFNITKSVDGQAREATSHEVDHYWQQEQTAIALELEWNNKDTFFDRDLENFKRLHVESAISVGIIITRGKSFHESLKELVLGYCKRHDINSFDKLKDHEIPRTERQLKGIEKALTGGKSFEEAFSNQFVSDKFGESTTHWKKLQEKVHRGAGGSCPLVLVGWPKGIIEED